MTAIKNLDSFLIRELDGSLAMYFCRGPGKCTLGTKKRKKLSLQNKACPDCVKGDEQETLGAVANRISRGDA